MRDEFVESYDPTIQGVRTHNSERVVILNLFLVRGVQEDSRGRRRANMGKCHLPSGGQAPASYNSLLGPCCLYVNSSTNIP